MRSVSRPLLLGLILLFAAGCALLYQLDRQLRHQALAQTSNVLSRLPAGILSHESISVGPFARTVTLQSVDLRHPHTGQVLLSAQRLRARDLQADTDTLALRLILDGVRSNPAWYREAGAVDGQLRLHEALGLTDGTAHLELALRYQPPAERLHVAANYGREEAHIAWQATIDEASLDDLTGLTERRMPDIRIADFRYRPPTEPQALDAFRTAAAEARVTEETLAQYLWAPLPDPSQWTAWTHVPMPMTYRLLHIGPLLAYVELQALTIEPADGQGLRTPAHIERLRISHLALGPSQHALPRRMRLEADGLTLPVTNAQPRDNDWAALFRDLGYDTLAVDQSLEYRYRPETGRLTVTENSLIVQDAFAVALLGRIHGLRLAGGQADIGSLLGPLTLVQAALTYEDRGFLERALQRAEQVQGLSRTDLIDSTLAQIRRYDALLDPTLRRTLDDHGRAFLTAPQSLQITVAPGQPIPVAMLPLLLALSNGNTAALVQTLGLSLAVNGESVDLASEHQSQ